MIDFNIIDELRRNQDIFNEAISDSKKYWDDVVAHKFRYFNTDIITTRGERFIHKVDNLFNDLQDLIYKTEKI